MVGAPSSETASRMAASRWETPWGARRQRVDGVLTRAARRGAAEEQRDTQCAGGNYAGQDVEIFQPKRHRVPRFFRDPSRAKLQLVIDTLPTRSVCGSRCSAARPW